MAITVSVGSFLDQEGDDLPVKAIATAAVGYSVDDPGNTILTNVQAALDQPNTIRYAVTDIADTFKSSPITPATGQSTKGRNILVQMNEVWKVTDSTLGILYYLPVSGHLVLKVPLDSNIGGIAMSNFVSRLIGSIIRDFSAGAGTGLGGGIDSLLRGVTHLPETVTPAF